MKMKIAQIFFAASIIMFAVFQLPSSVQAQTQSQLSPQATQFLEKMKKEGLDSQVSAQPKENYKADIVNASVSDQEKNVIKVSFDIKNGQLVQPQIEFAVSLVEQKDGESTILDRKIYNDPVSLNAGETIHRDLQYIAPDFLNGDYSVKVEARNPSGFLLAQAMAEKVTLAGNGRYASFVQGTCEQRDQAKSKNLLPSPTDFDIIDISTGGDVSIICKIKNTFDSQTSAIPVVTVYERSAFGKQLSMKKDSNLVLVPGKSSGQDLKISLGEAPGTYWAVIWLEDGSGNRISTQGSILFIAGGKSLEVGNALFDKASYAKGDKANIVFAWPYTQGLNSKPESLGSSFDISLVDGSGKSCAEKYSAKLNFSSSENQVNTLQKAIVPVLEQCADPQAQISIYDDKGGLLDSQTFSVKIKEAASVTKNPLQTLTGSASSGLVEILKKILIVAAILVFLATLIIILMKKAKNSSKITVMALGLLIGAGLFGNIHFASAAVDWWQFNGCMGHLNIAPTKSTYAPGEAINFNVSALASACGVAAVVTSFNYGTPAPVGPAKTYVWTGMTGLSTSGTMPAPATLGAYRIYYWVSFNDGTYWVPSWSAGGYSDAITVANPPAPVNGACGSTAGNPMPADSTTWSASNVSNMCAVGTKSYPNPLPSNYLSWCIANGGNTPGLGAGCFFSDGKNHVYSNATNFLWTCLGSNGGSYASCSAPIASITVNGACGSGSNEFVPPHAAYSSLAQSDLTTTGCAAGTLTNFAGSGPWSWTCQGSGTGHTDASCAASKTCTSPQAPFTCFNPAPVCPTTVGTASCVDFCGNNVNLSNCSSCTPVTISCPSSSSNWREVIP